MIYMILLFNRIYFLLTKRALLDLVTTIPLFLPFFGVFRFYWLIGLVGLRIYRVVRPLQEFGFFESRGN